MRTTQTDRSAAARSFAIEAAKLAANTHCRDVLVLDVRGLSPVTDYFVVATGNSPRQMRTVSNEAEELGQSLNFAPLARHGYEGESWILLDCVDVVVHILSQEARHFYDLEGLWGDAKRIEWNDQPVNP